MDCDGKQDPGKSELETRSSLPKVQDATMQAEEGITKTETGTSWRRVVEEKLQRLHSLLFGVDLALQAQEWEKALGLGLRLVGFLDSECKTEQDILYIAPIMRQVHQKIDFAKVHIFQGIESRAFVQAGQTETPVFGGHGAVDIAKIKNSRLYQSFLRHDTISRRPDQNCATDLASDLLGSRILPGKCQNIELKNRAMGSSPQQIDSLIFKKSFAQTKMTTLFRGGSSKNTIKRGPSDSFGDMTTSQTASDSSVLPNTSSQVTVCQDSCIATSGFPSRSEEGNVPSGGENKKRAAYHSYQQDLRPPKFRSGGVDDQMDDMVKTSGFITAKQKWATDTLQKRCASSGASAATLASQQAWQPGGNTVSGNYATAGRTLGVPRRMPRSNFVPPVRSNGGMSGVVGAMTRNSGGTDNSSDESLKRCLELLAGPDGELPDKLRNLEPRLLEHVSNEIMEQDSNVRWDDIAGLDHAKKSVTEMVIWPLLRPDIFQGCRAPGKGLLLFGPPGTGKTMIGKAIAGEAQATFFSISASSLTSKWIGEGEKLVRALFGVAGCRQPAVIFIDEIDSLLSQRKAEGEHESSRRLKTQFLIEMEGVGSGNEQLLLIGATNRPQELDEAARRRFSKRLYIPLPSTEARAWIVRSLLEKDGLLSLSDKDVDIICASTEGYSGSDMKNLVKEASMGPLREALVQCQDISKISKEEMRSITLQDFKTALQQVRPSVSQSELGSYEDWNHQFGSLLL